MVNKEACFDEEVNLKNIQINKMKNSKSAFGKEKFDVSCLSCSSNEVLAQTRALKFLFSLLVAVNVKNKFKHLD
jgi:hypothetical protein